MTALTSDDGGAEDVIAVVNEDPNYNVPIGQPILRWSSIRDATEKSDTDYWDYYVVAPDTQDELITMWWFIGASSLLAALLILFVMTSILTNQKARSSSFNMYLVYLMLPDLFYSGPCVFVCWLSAQAGYFLSEGVCRYESFYLTAGIAGNSWINVMITKEIHKMLCAGNVRLRYKPPTRLRVFYEALLVYGWVGVLGAIAILPPSNFPVRTYSQNGYACIPVPYDKTSTIFFYVVWFQLLSGIPLLYVGYVTLDVLFIRKLLPTNNRARIFTFYFLRIVIMFFLWWAPALGFIFVWPNTSPWVKFICSIWTHLQGFASALLIWLKPDIWQASKELITCYGCRNKDGVNDDTYIIDGSNRDSSGSSSARWHVLASKYFVNKKVPVSEGGETGGGGAGVSGGGSSDGFGIGSSSLRNLTVDRMKRPYTSRRGGRSANNSSTNARAGSAISIQEEINRFNSTASRSRSRGPSTAVQEDDESDEDEYGIYDDDIGDNEQPPVTEPNEEEKTNGKDIEATKGSVDNAHQINVKDDEKNDQV